MKKVFIFWDNSNIFVGARDVAEAKEGADARYNIRISFDRLYRLATADRKVESALAVGSVPPEMRHVWNRLESAGVKVELFERGSASQKEQAVDQALQVHMLRQTIDNNGNPGTVVLLTGDGKGFFDGVGFHADLERMHKKGWNIEVLAWDLSCNKHLKEWASKVGIFIALEDFYKQITYTEDSSGSLRRSDTIDLSKRKVSPP